jgi:hypothetical protein
LPWAASTIPSALALKMQVSGVLLKKFTATQQNIDIGSFQHQNINFPLVPTTWESPVGWRSIVISIPITILATAFVVVCSATAHSAFVVVRHLLTNVNTSFGDFKPTSGSLLSSAELRNGFLPSIAKQVHVFILLLAGAAFAEHANSYVVYSIRLAHVWAVNQTQYTRTLYLACGTSKSLSSQCPENCICIDIDEASATKIEKPLFLWYYKKYNKSMH